MNCQYPDCPSGRAEVVQDQRHKDTMDQLSKITSNQEQTIRLLSDLNNLTSNFKDLKEQNTKDHDEIFTRLRAVESGKADVGDVKEIKKAGVRWLIDIAKLAVAAALGALGIKVFN